MSSTVLYFDSFTTNSTPEVENQQCKWGYFNTLITVLLLLTFILNVLASVVLFRVPLTTMRGKSNPVYFCIRFLNICDVLQSAFLTIMPAFTTPECDWIGGEISCNIMGFIALFFLLVSPLITILMAFDRVVALYLPFKYRSQLGLKMLKVMLPSSCALVVVITILPIFGIGKYHVVKGRRFCLLDTITENTVDRRYVLAVHAIFLLALLFMLCCTAAIQSKLVLMSFTKKEKDGKSKARKKSSSRRTRNATLTAMAVCGIFVICYMPYVIRVLIEAARVKKSSTPVTWLTFALAFTQPLLNPIVCIISNARYRKELKALLRNRKVTEVDTSTESVTNRHVMSRRTNSFTGPRRRHSGRNDRGSRRQNKPTEMTRPHSVCACSPSSPRPFLATNETRDHCNLLLRSPIYTANGGKNNGNINFRSSYRMSTPLTSPTMGSHHFELFSMGDIRSLSNSSGVAENGVDHVKHAL